MPTHRSTSGSSSGLGRRLATAATVLPLAIGLASNGLPGGHTKLVDTKPAETASARSTAAFELSCTLPFEALSQSHPIDDACGPDGKSDPNSPQAVQNDAKNNFCAD